MKAVASESDIEELHAGVAARLRSFATSRLAADAVTGALGMNVWASLVLTPAMFVGSFARVKAYGPLAALALLPLAIGLVRRSATLLLLVFPLFVVLPLAVDPRAASGAVYGPLAFGMAAVGLIAYLLGASFLTAMEATPPREAKRLPGPPAAPRWRRRVRIYVYLVGLSVVFPAALLWVCDFSPVTRAFVRELFKDRVEAMTMVMNLGVLLLWLLLHQAFFLGPLRLHRTGDRPLVKKLELIRRDAARGTPNPIFYAAVVCALGFMGLLIYLRYR